MLHYTYLLYNKHFHNCSNRKCNHIIFQFQILRPKERCWQASILKYFITIF